LSGARAVIYAHGLGPLKTHMGKKLTRAALSLADGITVRDSSSLSLVKDWHLEGELSADPVWCLDDNAYGNGDAPARRQPDGGGSPGTTFKVGLSLRESANFTEKNLSDLIDVLAQVLPDNAEVLLLPLQKSQDERLLSDFHQRWTAINRRSTLLDTAKLSRPSQWLSIMRGMDLVVGMRLHALILAMKCAVPVVGIAYDPKVERLLTKSRQPILNLTN